MQVTFDHKPGRATLVPVVTEVEAWHANAANSVAVERFYWPDHVVARQWVEKLVGVDLLRPAHTFAEVAREVSMRQRALVVAKKGSLPVEARAGDPYSRCIFCLKQSFGEPTAVIARRGKVPTRQARRPLRNL